jgi:hypothetical protein
MNTIYQVHKLISFAPPMNAGGAKFILEMVKQFNSENEAEDFIMNEAEAGNFKYVILKVFTK